MLVDGGLGAASSAAVSRRHGGLIWVVNVSNYLMYKGV